MSAQLLMLPAERRESAGSKRSRAGTAVCPNQARPAEQVLQVGRARVLGTGGQQFHAPRVARQGRWMLYYDFESDPRISGRLRGMRRYVTVPETVWEDGC